jgi:molybdopterin synthase catalytic subunit
VAEIVRARIDAGALATAAARTDCGAIAQFQGTTRDHHGGRRVTRLEYEAYESMAQAVLDRLEREAIERVGVASCAIVVRLGEVPAGEASVVVTVAAGHRGPAFDACRWAIDSLKLAAPIWKKEHFAGGGADWVEGTPLA